MFSKSADFGVGEGGADLMENSKEFESLFFETKKARRCGLLLFFFHGVMCCDVLFCFAFAAVVVFSYLSLI